MRKDFLSQSFKTTNRREIHYRSCGPTQSEARKLLTRRTLKIPLCFSTRFHFIVVCLLLSSPPLQSNLSLPPPLLTLPEMLLFPLCSIKPQKYFLLKYLGRSLLTKNCVKTIKAFFYFFFWVICKVVSLPLHFKCQMLNKQCYLAANESPNEVLPLAVRKMYRLFSVTANTMNHQSKVGTADP